MALQTKANGGRQLVIAYMSIGEAEDYRYVLATGLAIDSPSWLDAENPDWAGNYKSSILGTGMAGPDTSAS